MIRTLLISTAASAALAFALPAVAQDMSHDDMKHEDMQHDDMHHEEGEHDHADHDHADHEGHADEGSTPGESAVLSRTDDIDTALAAGGEPVVAEVLGVVCDFCAKAMNKTFGKRAEVAATYVDLDTKTLNLVFKPGQTLDDETINELVGKAGYKISAIHRGNAVILEGGDDASDPA